MINEIYYYVGLYGALLYLASYFLLQAGFVRGNSYTYTLLNLAASSCVAISLLDAFNAASFVIQASWIVLSIYGLGRMTMIHYTTRFSAEESSFLKSKLPDMPKNIARNLLKNAVWIEGKAGSELTRQGVQNSSLIYIPDATADVFVDGALVARITPPSFVGEMTCLTGAPATATTLLNEDARYMAISAEVVRQMARKDLDFRTFLELSFARDVQAKLESANKSDLKAGAAWTSAAH